MLAVSSANGANPSIRPAKPMHTTMQKAEIHLYGKARHSSDQLVSALVGQKVRAHQSEALDLHRLTVLEHIITRHGLLHGL